MSYDINAFSLHIIKSGNVVVLNLLSSQFLFSITQGFALKLPYVSGLWSCVFLHSLRFLQQSSDTLTATSSLYRTRKGKAPVTLMVCGQYRRFTKEHLASCGCVVIRQIRTSWTNSPFNVETISYNLHNSAKCTETHIKHSQIHIFNINYMLQKCYGKFMSILFTWHLHDVKL